MESAQTLYATQDASIKENSSTNGDWSKNEVYGSSTPVIALVEFDLSSFSKGDRIQSAKFRPYIRTLKNNQSSSFSIYSTTAKDWSQSSVKWSTRPPKDQLLDSITITKSGSYVDFEVTNSIQNAIDNGQSKVTLWIEDSEKEYEGFEFDSVNKNPSYPNEPELVIISGVAEPDTTAPTFSSAATSTDGAKVILTYNETLSSTTATASDFTVTADGSAATIAGVATSGTTVELTLSSAVTNGQTVTVAYTDPTSGNDSNAIQDAAGNDAATLNTTTVSNQVAEAGQGVLQILGSTVNDKDWDQHVGGKHLRADLSQLNDRDTAKAIAYQWYANDVAVSGATSRDFKLEEHSINSEAIHLVATYTTLSGKQRIATSPTVNQLDWRIFSGGEDGTVEGDNPTPFMETYSFSNSSATHGGGGWYEDGYQASDTHSIRSTTASELGLSTDEGSKILKIAGTSDSKRAELGNRNWNTRVQENQDIYVSEMIYLPKEEWDPVTKYSTIIFQHKQYPGADPNFELRLSNEGDYKLYAQSPYGHYGLTGDKHNDHHIATLSPDTWHDLKIHLTPSQSSSKGQITIYLDGEAIFSEKGTNLNDKDNTNDSFLKLGMYTQILDDRHYFVDAVEMATFLPSTVSDWVNGTTTDTTVPTFISAATSTDGSKVVLTYNETLSSTTAAASAFFVTTDGNANAVTAVAVSGSTVELTLTNIVKKDQTVTAAYTDPSSSNDSNVIQDTSGNDAASLSENSVTNTSTVVENGPKNEPPSALILNNTLNSLPENSSTKSRIKLADIAITDDDLGTNLISLAGPDASSFEVEGSVLFLKAGAILDFETQATYSISLTASDPDLPGTTPVTVTFSLAVEDLAELPQIQSIDDIKTQKKISIFQINTPLAIAGKIFNEIIVGTKKKDKITGTPEGEILAGMKGKDVLKGGDSADGFLFNQLKGFGNKHADQIKDFDSGEGDSILLDNDLFELGKKIKLKSYASRSKVKKAVKSKNDFVYEEKKGLLYFNENGKQKGWGDGGLFAKLQGAPELGAEDFTIV